MTTFVPLAADIDGTVSAVAVGDWLLHLLKLKRPDCSNAFYEEFVHLAQSIDPTTNEHVIDNPFSLFELLLSQEDLVFSWLIEALHAGEAGVIAPLSEPVGGAPPPTGGGTGGEGAVDGGCKEVRKTYSEVLREVEDMFGVLMCMLVLRVRDPEEVGMAAGKLCEVFKRSTVKIPEFGLKLLMSLYNVFPPNFRYRFPIFVATLEFAADNNLFNLMLPYIAYIDEWMKDWNLDQHSKRGVFLILARQLKKLGKPDEAYPFLRRHVEGFQGESKEIFEMSSTIEAAAELAADSIRQPDVMYFDKLFTLDAFKQLRSSPSHSRLVDLVDIFMRGGPKDLLKFHDANPSLFQEYGLNKADCLAKIRLLALASRCLRSSELTLKDLGEAVGLADKDDVEELVVQAIGQNLVDAKIDQTNRTVQIKSAMQREFGRAQWEQLLFRLNTWSENVKTLKKCLTDCRQRSP